MFPPNPMYETNGIQLDFLLWFFWYISQWPSWICSIFCTRLYSKDIHCGIPSITYLECFYASNAHKNKRFICHFSFVCILKPVDSTHPPTSLSMVSVLYAVDLHITLRIKTWVAAYLRFIYIFFNLTLFYATF